MGNLFELTGEFLQLQQLLADFDGDISEAQKEAEIDKLFADLAENQDQLEDKLDSYVSVMSEFEARFEYRRREAKRLGILANKDEAEFNRLEERLKSFFKLIGKNEIQSKLHKFKLNKTGGKQALELKREFTQDELQKFDERFVTIIPEKVVPRQFVLNKDAIREALEAKEELDFAELLPKKENLKIT